MFALADNAPLTPLERAWRLVRRAYTLFTQWHARCHTIYSTGQLPSAMAALLFYQLLHTANNVSMAGPSVEILGFSPSRGDEHNDMDLDVGVHFGSMPTCSLACGAITISLKGEQG